MSKSSVAFVGLGNMGLPMATRLVQAGHAVAGFDLDPAAAERLAAVGGTAFRNVQEAVEVSDIVVLMLPDSNVVQSVLNSLLKAGALRTGALMVDMSSSIPTRTREIAQVLADNGIPMVDAPVSGGVGGAKNGTLAIMAGGKPSDIARARPVLEVLGRVFETGPVGSGHAAKALNNLLSATHFWATSEAVAIGSQFGIKPDVLLEVVNNSSGRSGSSERKWPQFVLTGTYDSGFSASLMLKDIRIATSLAEELKRPTVLGGHLATLWADALERLDPQADHTEIAKAILEKLTADAGRP